MLKISGRKIVTVEKRKNVGWKVNGDLKISYKNVQLQQKVIPKKLTQVQQKVTLSNDITTTESHLEIENMQMIHHYRNTSWK